MSAGKKTLTNIRAFNLSEDYVTMGAWWRAHESYPPKPEHLTEFGYVIELAGEPVAAFFMYPMGTSKICYLGFPVLSFRCPRDMRPTIIEKMLGAANIWAQQRGFDIVYISIGKVPFIEKMKEFGFIEADKGNSHMFLEVK
jgi:hypothetical protein